MSLNMNFEKELKNVESKVVIENMMKILEDRIHDNKSEMNKIIFYLLLCFLSFFLIKYSFLDEISLGPIKLKINLFFYKIIPIVFSFFYIKYLTLWFLIVRQKSMYKILFKKNFEIENEFINQFFYPYSFFDNVIDSFSSKRGFFMDKIFFILISIFLLTPYLILIIFLKDIYSSTDFDKLYDLITFIVPMILTIYIIFYTVYKIKEIINNQKIK